MDKILAAFNRAYAIGEIAIADRLRDILASEQTVPGQPPQHDALAQADSWVEFVEARNRYRGVCANRRNDPNGASAALAEMEEAYRRWSLS